MFSFFIYFSFYFFFFFNDTATTEIYTVSDTLSLHDALPTSSVALARLGGFSPFAAACSYSSSARRRSEEHTSELQSPDTSSYAVLCLKKKFVKIGSRRDLSSAGNLADLKAPVARFVFTFQPLDCRPYSFTFFFQFFF